MRDKFLFGLNNSFSRFREDIFYRDGQCKAEDPPFTLAFVITQAVSFEAAQQTNKLLAHSFIEEQVHYITSMTPTRNFQWPPGKPVSKCCFFCGSKTPHPREKCPAQGQTCSYCHKLGHFSSVCQQAVKDQRSARPPHKKPPTPTPRCEHIHMVDLDQSLTLPSADGIQYKHCFTILDMGLHTAHASSTVADKGHFIFLDLKSPDSNHTIQIPLPNQDCYNTLKSMRNVSKGFTKCSHIPKCFKGFQKGFQSVSKGFPKGFKVFQKGFQRVSKGFQKCFQTVSKAFPTGLKPSETGFQKGSE